VAPGLSGRTGWGFTQKGEATMTGILSKKESGIKLYFGNLSYEVTEEDLRQVFEPFGQDESATIT
jgi:RNA recognition motif-containing protein